MVEGTLEIQLPHDMSTVLTLVVNLVQQVFQVLCLLGTGRTTSLVPLWLLGLVLPNEL